MDDEKPAYDLEERTYQYALQVRVCISGGKWAREQWTDVDQVLRSSGSVAANYIEANNAVSKPDFIFRIRVSKKEASESKLWLRLLEATSQNESTKITLRRTSQTPKRQRFTYEINSPQTPSIVFNPTSKRDTFQSNLQHSGPYMQHTCLQPRDILSSSSLESSSLASFLNLPAQNFLSFSSLRFEFHA